MYTITLEAPDGEIFKFELSELGDTRFLALGSPRPKDAAIFSDYGEFLYAEVREGLDEKEASHDQGG